MAEAALPALSTVSIVLAALVWLGVLFLVALVGERRAHGGRTPGAWAYALALGVYCTSWTFYGTVTQALRSGWWLPPTFVGTILIFVLAWPFLKRLVTEAHAQNSTTLADFVAAKLGKNSTLAAAITGVVLLGTLPYLALQLKAVSTSFDLLAGRDAQSALVADSALWVALVMAIFAILFGTRRAAASDRNPGLILAIAFESLFKLAAMLALGAFVLFGLDLPDMPTASPSAGGGDGFLALIVLGALAMFTLPHQFHVGVIECADAGYVRRARWRFPLFLALIALPTLPLAWAGALALGDRLPSDLYVLGLPLAADRPLVALLACLGGLSAATAMVVVATLALSLMIGNHWLAPLRGPRWARGEGAADLRGHVLAVRRVGILGVLLLAWLYSRLLAGNDALADIGAQSFSALAQLAPAVLVAIYAPRTPARAVLAGLAGGVLVWSYVLLLPQLAAATGRSYSWIGQGPFGLSWFAPENLLGLRALEGITRATLIGFAANAALILLFARRRQERSLPDGVFAIDDLHRLAARFLEAPALQQLFGARRAGRADADLAARVEHALAGVIGAASARVLLDALARRDVRELEAVAELVGETSQALRFNQRLLEAALENMSQGISVVDKDLRLVAWNRRYAELFRFPPALLRIGTPIEKLVRHNARVGFLGDGDAEAMVERRLAHMRAGTPYVSERTFADGTVVEIRGNPMPGGGFVATFTDVTNFRRAENELKQIAETLEQRVIERTAESEHARAEAERANRAKTRFLAAVSHDLAQPLNAAKLFTHALAQRLADDPQRRDDVGHIGGALRSAEDLLAGLLDISRLDAGGMSASVRAFALGEMLQHLATEFRVLAREKGLVLDAVPTRAWVSSDPQLLRRILQNFLANAVRYTRNGRVLLGCRRRGDAMSIEIWDTGPGIAESEQAAVFEEFRRLERDGQGLGLGLAIAERIAQLLSHPLRLRSWPGRGTVFTIDVPQAVPVASPLPVREAETSTQIAGRILVVDNDATVVRAMSVLLDGWHCEVLAARDSGEALRLALAQPPDMLLLDYHLDGAETGLVLRARLAQAIGERPTIVITADHGEPIRLAVAAAGCHLLHKPLKPLALKSLMSRLLTAAPATHPYGTRE